MSRSLQSGRPGLRHPPDSERRRYRRRAVRFSRLREAVFLDAFLEDFRFADFRFAGAFCFPARFAPLPTGLALTRTAAMTQGSFVRTLHE